MFAHYRFIYNGKVEITEDRVAAQLCTANQFQLDGMVSACSTWILQNITDETACHYWAFSDRYRHLTLHCDVKCYIFKHPIGVLKSTTIVMLPRHLFIEFLCVANPGPIAYDHADDIYSACVKWASRECTDNGQLVNDTNISDTIDALIARPAHYPPPF